MEPEEHKRRLGYLRQRQALDLDSKITLSQVRIKEWYDYWGGAVYVAFSGGKDSTVLRHLVKSLYPWVPAVFCDTGLEYPELREFARRTADEVITPSMPFNKVIEKYGYPVISKKVSGALSVLQNETEANKATCDFLRTGITAQGKESPRWKVPDKWQYLAKAPFKISDKCCKVMKKEPFYKYARDNGNLHPYLGILAEESLLREQHYLEYGCNAFDVQEPSSTPMGFWTEEDVLMYIKKYNLEYAACYGEIVNEDGVWKTTGLDRTGCMFCMFGVHLEEEPNRFQKMQLTHPKQWDYCIHKLKLGEVLDYIHVPYEYDDGMVDGI